MTRIKLFFKQSVRDLKRTVNSWLDQEESNIKIIDIKLATAFNGGGADATIWKYAMIIYERINTF